jgi:tetratricopeptide (TPR) repeat protein
VDRAMADYNEAIEVDAKFLYTYINRGVAYSDERNLEQAIADFTLG